MDNGDSTSSYSQQMKVKTFNIYSGKLIALMNEIDAKELGIFALERVQVRNQKTGKALVVVVDLTTSMVEENEVGLFEEAQKILAVKNGQEVEVKAVERPESVAFIKKKMDKQKLTAGELKAIVDDIANDRLSDIEASAFMSSVYINGFDLEEIVAMTNALIADGRQLKFEKEFILDKHSVGGTNGRTTMIVVPIIAAAGYLIPKTSSRSITSAAGTADSMEVLANVSLSLERIRDITNKVGGVISWGGAVDLAPVDDKMIKLEHPLSLDPKGQVIASVMSKKASVGAKFLVIDLPVGPEVKIKSRETAEEMARDFIEVGKRVGIKVEAVLTDGDEPVGMAFGPALEAKEVMETLEGKKWNALAEKSCGLAGALFELVGRSKKGEGHRLAKEILTSGMALEKMKEIIKAQDGKILRSEDVRLARFKKEVKAKSAGEIKKINVKKVIEIARLSGAPADKRAGVLLKVLAGESIREGQILYEIYSENTRKLDLAEKQALKSRVIDFEEVIIEEFV
ncbi:MAG: AMP phosphorylase [Candidatus Diapherotrites archaeon]